MTMKAYLFALVAILNGVTVCGLACYSCFSRTDQPDRNKPCTDVAYGCSVCYTKIMTTKWSKNVLQDCGQVCQSESESSAGLYTETNCCHSDLCNQVLPEVTFPGSNVIGCYNCYRMFGKEETPSVCTVTAPGCSVCFTRILETTSNTIIEQGCGNSCPASTMNWMTHCCNTHQCNTAAYQIKSSAPPTTAVHTTRKPNLVTCYSCYRMVGKTEAFDVCAVTTPGCTVCYTNTLDIGSYWMIEQRCGSTCPPSDSTSNRKTSCCSAELCNIAAYRTIVTDFTTASALTTTARPTRGLDCHECFQQTDQDMKLNKCSGVSRGCDVCYTRTTTSTLGKTILRSCASVCPAQPDGVTSMVRFTTTCCYSSYCNTATGDVEEVWSSTAAAPAPTDKARAMYTCYECTSGVQSTIDYCSNEYFNPNSAYVHIRGGCTMCKTTAYVQSGVTMTSRLCLFNGDNCTDTMETHCCQGHLCNTRYTFGSTAVLRSTSVVFVVSFPLVLLFI